MTMALYNKVTRDIYGYFGTPYPTRDTAIEMCFPDVNIHQDETTTDESGNEIWLKDLELGFPEKKIKNFRLEG